MTSVDSKRTTEESVTVMGGARSEGPAALPGAGITGITGITDIGAGELGEVSGGILDKQPAAMPRPPGLPLPQLPKAPSTTPLGPFYPSPFNPNGDPSIA